MGRVELVKAEPTKLWLAMWGVEGKGMEGKGMEGEVREGESSLSLQEITPKT